MVGGGGGGGLGTTCTKCKEESYWAKSGEI